MATCIENLRPKTIPEGLVALGTISQVSESHIKLQVPGGVVCLVNLANISQVYCDLMENQENPPPKLPELFKRGQQYVCKVIERTARKGYAEALDIHATLDPSSILEDVIASNLLSIPYIPMQCVVKSIEDHGYQLDVGLKGYTGFLEFKNSDDYCEEHNDGKKFSLGQVVRCYLSNTIKQSSETRVIRLTLEKEASKLSEFSRTKCSEVQLTEKCILPGSRTFLTVMGVEKDGLTVNLMNEFKGFVGFNHLKDEWHTPTKDYKISDQFDCKVLYYNSTTGNFALSLRQEEYRQKRLKYFLSNFHVGKFIEDAKVAFLIGSKAVYFKIDEKYKAIANVKDALDEDVGTLTKDEINLALDAKFPDNSTHRCRVKSINLADLTVIVGLRKAFLNEPHLSLEELKIGDMVNATARKYVKDGIIVSLGLNLRAIIMNEYLQDYISNKTYKKYPIGQKIKCRVLRIDTDRQPPRVYFTNKTELMSKDLTIVDAYDRSLKGKTTCATIVKINPTGVIVEFFNDVKGFLPNRFSSSVNLKEIGTLFKVGQVIPCTIYKSDPKRRSIMVGVISYDKIMKMKKTKKLKKDVEKKNKDRRKLDEKLDRDSEKLQRKTTKKIESNDEIKVDSKKSKKIKTKAKSIVEHVTKTDNGPNNDEVESSDSSDSSQQASKENIEDEKKQIKTRRQRSEEAMERESKLREAESRLLDSDRPPQSILDFERLALASPNSAEVWTKYSKFFLDNVETEKARIVCRRALKTINFRLEKEKLKVWLHLIKIEAKYGGTEKLREVIEEASKVTDPMMLYQGAVKLLTNCGELNEAERLFELMLKIDKSSVNVWISYIDFSMDQRKDADKSRQLFERALKSVTKAEQTNLRSRFARIEFKSGDVERGKTIFENLLNDNPKRTDLWRVYEQMIRKYGTRQLDTQEIRELNEQTLKRVAESIETVDKRKKKRN